MVRRPETGAEGVEKGVENTSRREPAAGVRAGVGAALRDVSTAGVAADTEASVSAADDATMVAPVAVVISALPTRDVAFRAASSEIARAPRTEHPVGTSRASNSTRGSRARRNEPCLARGVAVAARPTL